MKEIKAIIRPFKLLEVTEELHKIDGLPGVTVSEIKGFGSKARNAKDKLVYETVEMIPRVKLEVVVHDDMAAAVVNVIQKVGPHRQYGRWQDIRHQCRGNREDTDK